MTSSEIASIVNGILTGPGNLPVSDIVTDSRNLSFTEGMVFFAISGKNHDGHQFIGNLYARGIRVFVAERLPEGVEKLSEAAFIKVPDSITALQDIAVARRKAFISPVIAVTGSAGKTVVKEWLADILGLSLPVMRSPRSYNSQVGVPLSVWKLDNRYKLGIIEAGISRPGEMERLQRVIDPDIGVITNIGQAHSEGFDGDEEKAGEKLRLFINSRAIVYCSDYELIDRLLKNDRNFSSKQLFDWSFNRKDASIFVSGKIVSDNSTEIILTFNGADFTFVIPFTDRASVENAITSVSVCLVLNTDPDIIRQGIRELHSVAMRMELRNGINNCMLIADYYNSDPGSLGMALDFLRSQNSRKRTLILSDFVGSGGAREEVYARVAEEIRKADIHRFIGIGPDLSEHSTLFGTGARVYYSTREFINDFNAADFSGETILLKGARKFEFEDIGRLLEQQIHQTVLEISLDAIAHNLNEFRRFLSPGTRIMCMVKAFAYGAGPSEIGGLLEYHRVSCLGVAFADEGVELRNAGITLPVMVMNPDPGSADLIIRYGLEPVLFSFSSLREFARAASRHGILHYPVHIKLDTGMHRLGFMTEEVEELASLLAASESLKVVSVFSHFAASEDPSLDSFTHRQAGLFIKAADVIGKAAGYSFLRHICNSAGIIRFPRYHFEMVRPGIGIYGAGEFGGLHLKPAARFMTSISQVKRIPPGEPVGYGCADVSDKERIIGIVPVGYADGLNRKLGNRKGSMLIGGTRVPVIGNICMDMCMVDITGVDAGEGDEAEIFGEHIKIEELAEKCGTIPYEILTSIPPRVKRVFFRE